MARSLSSGRSRRGLLRGLAATTGLTLFAGRQPGIAVAQAAGVPLGGACASDAECANDFMGAQPICADNGIAADGALTCCRTSGCCGSDGDCCGSMLCAPTGDVCSVCKEPPFATKGLGQPCAGDDECIPTPSGIVACADNGVADDVATTCCLGEGGVCFDDATCCGAMTCLDNRCRIPGDLGLLPGTVCGSDAECGQAGGVTVCRYQPADAASFCCRPEGQPCGTWSACCVALRCSGGTCRHA